jgi:hypothetical protein
MAKVEIFSDLVLLPLQSSEIPGAWEISIHGRSA